MRTAHVRSVLVVAALAAASAAAGGLHDEQALGERVLLRTTVVPLSRRNPRLARLGALEFRGAVAIRSSDERFGGLSGLHVSPDGRHLVAVTDHGSWLTARLVYDDRGRLEDVRDAEMGPLRGPDGRRLGEEKEDHDAEALTLAGDGTFLVSFEGRHRIYEYAEGIDGPADPLPRPDGLEDAPANRGVEALVTLADGRLLALTEGFGENRLFTGWIWRRGRWLPVAYRARWDSSPADAALLPSGDVLVLERGDNDEDEPVVRIQRIRRGAVGRNEELEGETLVELRPPLLTEAFEGLSCREGEDGEPLIYVISDNGFDDETPTVLVMFALTHGEIEKGRRSGQR